MNAKEAKQITKESLAKLAPEYFENLMKDLSIIIRKTAKAGKSYATYDIYGLYSVYCIVELEKLGYSVMKSAEDYDIVKISISW